MSCGEESDISNIDGFKIQKLTKLTPKDSSVKMELYSKTEAEVSTENTDVRKSGRMSKAPSRLIEEEESNSKHSGAFSKNFVWLKKE